MARSQLSRSRRREDIQACWAEHLAVQRKIRPDSVCLLPSAGAGPEVLYALEGQVP